MNESKEARAEDRQVSPQEQRSFVTERPVAILMLFIAAVVFGYFSLGGCP